MANDFWVIQENIRRFRERLQSPLDLQARATLEALLQAEEAKLASAEQSATEVRGKIKRYRGKADELRAVADQTQTDSMRDHFRMAADTYDALARTLENTLSGRDAAEKAGL